MVYGALTRSDGAIDSTCRSCSCHLSYGRIFSQSPSETAAGAVHVLNHRTRNWFTGKLLWNVRRADSSWWNVKRRGGRRGLQQASVSMATTTSPTATNFMLCWGAEGKKKRVGYWWLWLQYLPPSKRALMHSVIISNLQFVHPSPLFLLLTLLLSRNKKKSPFPRIPCSSLLPPTVCHICHRPPNNNRPQQISSLLSHFLSHFTGHREWRLLVNKKVLYLVFI